VTTLGETEVLEKVAETGPRQVGAEIDSGILRQAPGADEAFANSIRRDDVLEKAFVEAVLVPMVPEAVVVARCRPRIGRLGLVGIDLRGGFDDRACLWRRKT